MTVDELIVEMQECKTAHNTLSIDPVLQIFNIQAMKDLTKMIWRVSR